MATSFDLKCRGCGAIYSGDEYHAYCAACGRDALLYTRYFAPYNLQGAEDQFASYSDWLPFSQLLGKPGPTMYAEHKIELGKEIGLDDLWILVSGNVPTLGARFTTGTFKETEALGVLSRVTEQTNKILIISSAGNAARAFLEYSIRLALPVIVVVPDAAVPDLMLTVSAQEGRGPLLLSLIDAVYSDAIHFVDAAVAEYPDQLVREGGAFNVARRDAMAVPFLFAARRMGGLPRWYVQAVGSGTGAIASWEASRRLIDFGMVADSPMGCLLVQNAPFAPMVDAWQAGDRQVVALPDDVARERLAQVKARVLSNAQPPYAVSGGVYDVLTQSKGGMVAVNNDEIHDATDLAREALGFSPCPAAAAALAGLRRAVAAGQVKRNERVLLHLTGAGLDRMTRENGYQPYNGGKRFNRADVGSGLREIGNYLREVAKWSGEK